jgi:hypothetical protein
MRHTILLALLVSAFMTTREGRAQNSYARLAGDTLHYVEATDVDVQVRSPQGTIDVVVELDSEMALTFPSPDTMTAWYVSLAVSNESPMGNVNPSTSGVIGKPFRVSFGPQGQVETLSAPPVPDELRGLSDIRRQFDEFFLILPEDELEVGMSWEYNVARDDSIAGEGRNAYTKSGTLTVVGDTTVSGIPGLKIVGDLAATLSVSTIEPSMGARVLNEFAGVEKNLIVFSPDRGVMIVRDRSADLSGTTEIVGGPMPISMQQEISYVTTARLQP